MIGDNVEAARLQRAEDGLIHGGAIYPEMPEVVIVEHQGHQIKPLRRQVRGNGILEGPGEGDDRRGRNAGFAEPSLAIGQCDGRWPRCGRKSAR